MIDEVMFEIREMTGQVYKNVYAGKSTESGTPVATIASTDVPSVAGDHADHVSDPANRSVASGH
jgi:hypothetical protein